MAIVPVMMAAVAVVLGTGYGFCNSFLEHLCHRDVPGSPAIVHFHNSTLTATNLRALNGMLADPQDGNKAVFHNGDFVANGELMMGGFKNGILHGNLSISMTENGDTHHGQWLVVNNEAEAEMKKTFDNLLLHFTGANELPILEAQRMLQILAEAASEEA